MDRTRRSGDRIAFRENDVFRNCGHRSITGSDPKQALPLSGVEGQKLVHPRLSAVAGKVGFQTTLNCLLSRRAPVRPYFGSNGADFGPAGFGHWDGLAANRVARDDQLAITLEGQRITLDRRGDRPSSLHQLYPKSLLKAVVPVRLLWPVSNAPSYQPPETPSRSWHEHSRGTEPDRDRSNCLFDLPYDVRAAE